MPAETAEPTIETTEKRYNMRLLLPTYFADMPPHRFPEGAVLQVDGDTAYRWIEHGVAEPAPRHAQSFRDQERERKAAVLARLEEMGAAEPVYNAAITRESFRDEQIGPKPMPKRAPRGKAARAALEGAEVVNAEEIISDEDDGEDFLGTGGLPPATGPLRR